MKPDRPTTIHNLLMPELLNLVQESCISIPDSIKRAAKISLLDCLMSGVAMFSLKYPSLLQFDNDCRHDKLLQHNLRTLFGINNTPSDTYFRERLDFVEPYELQRPIDNIINLLKENKTLGRIKYNIHGDDKKNNYLVSIDATGNFSSHEVHCDSCCVKHHKDGTVTYYHQTLAAVMVHPEHNVVFPLAIEPITKRDGATKNDCEHSAAKRLLVNLRNSHPDLNITIVMDGLYADGVIISLLKKLRFSFIITAIDADLPYLFDEYNISKKQEFSTKYPKEPELHYVFAERMSLNYTHNEVKVNVLECTETKKDKKTRFCWITDLDLTTKTVQKIARAGRSRWRIENETFNTLKNQGYHFEHNFGHGVKNLSSVLTYLMFIAFLIDQTLQFCCEFFMKALITCKSKTRLWKKIYAKFSSYFIDSWEQLYLVIIQGLGGRLSHLLDTS
jgi:hypothetical protein